MEKASFNIFLITIFLGIVTFVSPIFLPLAAVKTAVIGIGVLVSLILYIISRVRAGSVSVAWNPLIIVGGLIGLSVVISAVFSISPYSSFMGKNFGAGAGLFLLTLLMAGLLSTALVRTRDRVLVMYTTIIGSFCLLAVFHFIRFIPGATNALSFGSFGAVTSTPVGSWYDFGIFAGVVAIFSLLSLELFPLAKKLRILVAGLFGISVILLVIVGLPVIWIALAITALGITIKRYFDNRTHASRTTFFSRISIFPASFFIFAAVFAWHGNYVTNPVVNILNASYAELSLPWRYTLDIITPTLKAVPLFGVGPDRFTSTYLQFKPESINSTQAWSVDFPSSASFFLTTLVTQGLVGFILWIIFLALFVRAGARTLIKKHEDEFSRYTLAMSFFGSSFLLLMMVFYVPSHAMLLLAFVMVGLFVSELVNDGYIKTTSYTLLSVSKMRILIMGGVGVVILVVGVAGILFIKETVGQMYVQYALRTVNVSSSADGAALLENISRAKMAFTKAIRWNNVDTTYQAIAQADILEINTRVANAASTSSESLALAVRTLLTEGINFSHSAQKLDAANVYNYTTEASVSEVAVSLRIPSAYENARAAYIKASQLEPLSPVIYLSLAKLDYFVGSTTLALSDLNTALQIKPDYTDALYEVGVISYLKKDYQTALAAFAQTFTVDQTYISALYFHALTLVRLGDTKNATAELSMLDKAYPNNPQITPVLNALEAGKSPFSDAQLPVASLTTTPPLIATSTPAHTKTTSPPRAKH